MNAFISGVITLAVLFIGIPILLKFFRLIGFYTIVNEKRAVIYVLFGNVVGQIKEAGIHFLWFELGWRAFFVNWLGNKYVIDMRLDQEYLRSQMVNSEEGAPMGIGIWYEMYISDPLAYKFKNADPRGSLAANVSNSTVRSLSNLPLEKMMSDRHSMSQTVRAEVSEKSQEWGYRLGSCYIRKVHFRDTGMIKQIESKVVNRLRQVTSAIKQDGANRVSIISGTAEKRAAIAFGEAATIRPKIVGETLKDISKDPDITKAMFEILEIEKIIDNNIPVDMIPNDNLIGKLLVSQKGNDVVENIRTLD